MGTTWVGENYCDVLGLFQSVCNFFFVLRASYRLALLSNNQNEEAYEAYTKAIQLEPTNEGYKQNLKIVEEKLRTSAATAFPV
jgi:hypothetical protein